MTACKKLKRGKNISIEDLYQNKNFVPPKEQNLETIFEEPKEAKDGAPILTSYRKFKRYLDFDPITGRVNKPKKRRLKKVKGRLRSASHSKVDISVILDSLNDLSDDCEMDLTVDASQSVNVTAEDSVNVQSIEDKTVKDDADHVIKNNLSVLPTVDESVYDDHVANNNLSVLPIVDEAVNDDHVTINKVIDNLKDKALNADLLCKTCSLVEKLCSCKLVSLKKAKKATRKGLRK